MTLGAIQNIYFNPVWNYVLESVTAQELKYGVGVHEVDISCYLLKGMLHFFLPRTRYNRAKKSFPLRFMTKARDFVFYKSQTEPRFTRHYNYKGLWETVWVDQCNAIMSLYLTATKNVG